MIPEQRFGRWVSIGVPVILIEGIALVYFVHLRYLIALHDVLPPVSLCVAIQIGFLVCAYWARKLAREQRRFGPMSFLFGFSSWATLLIVMHYGPLWRILSPVGDPLSFTVFAAFVTLASWLTMSRLRRS